MYFRSSFIPSGPPYEGTSCKTANTAVSHCHFSLILWVQCKVGKIFQPIKFLAPESFSAVKEQFSCDGVKGGGATIQQQFHAESLRCTHTTSGHSCCNVWWCRSSVPRLRTSVTTGEDTHTKAVRNGVLQTFGIPNGDQRFQINNNSHTRTSAVKTVDKSLWGCYNTSAVPSDILRRLCQEWLHSPAVQC